MTVLWGRQIPYL